MGIVVDRMIALLQGQRRATTALYAYMELVNAEQIGRYLFWPLEMMVPRGW